MLLVKTTRQLRGILDDLETTRRLTDVASGIPLNCRVFGKGGIEMFTDFMVMDEKFLLGFMNMPIGYGASWLNVKEGIKENDLIRRQNRHRAKIVLDASTVRMMSDKELVESLRFFAEREPEITALHTAKEFDFNEQFCSYADLELIVQSDLTPGNLLEEALAELSYRQGKLRPQIAKVVEERLPRRPEHGYVYVLRAPSIDPAMYKIGRAMNLDSRVKHLGIQLPWDIELVTTIESDDYVGLEKELHKRFADKRVKGEWFELSEEDIEYLKGLANEQMV